MLTVVRPVYYCEFCKRHNLTKRALEKHEPRCIYNPDRPACGWHSEPNAKIPRPADFTAALRENLDVDWLRLAVGGCPACMLAVVVQAAPSLNERVDLQFDYATEVERFRSEERQAEQGDYW